MNTSSRFGLRSRGLLTWLGVALLARLLGLLWAGPSLPCSYDECSYLELARALVSGAGFLTEKGFLWPPGYVVFLAPLVGPEGAVAAAPRVLQSLLGALLVLPVAAFAALAVRQAVTQDSPAADSRRRLAVHLACAWVALDPTLVAFSHYLWPETLFLILLVGAVVLLHHAPGSLRLALAAGLLFGLAALFRSVGFWLCLPLCLLSRWQLPLRRHLRVAAQVLVGAFLVILPWTIRNAVNYGSFVLIDATSGTNLYLGNSGGPPVTWDWGAPERSRVRGGRDRCDDGDFTRRDRCEQRRALAWIASHPLAFLQRAVTKWADLVNPTSFLVRHVRAGRYRGTAFVDVHPAAAAVATAAAAIPWILLAALATVGLAASPPSAPRRAVLLMVVAILFIHALTFGMSRFRLPAVPFLAAYAGIAVAGFRSGSWLPDGRRRLALVAVLLGLVALWTLRLGPLLDFTPLQFP